MAGPVSFSFKDVVVLFNGIPLTGFADGPDAIVIERNVDAYRLLIGADGDAVALKSANRSGVATLRFLQTSSSNAVLTAALKVQDAGLLSPASFAVKDSNSQDLVLAEGAFPAGPPSLAYGDDHNKREWRLALPAVDIFANGSI
jgi:hypothetical protein